MGVEDWEEREREFCLMVFVILEGGVLRALYGGRRGMSSRFS